VLVKLLKSDKPSRDNDLSMAEERGESLSTRIFLSQK